MPFPASGGRLTHCSPSATGIWCRLPLLAKSAASFSRSSASAWSPFLPVSFPPVLWRRQNKKRKSQKTSAIAPAVGANCIDMQSQSFDRCTVFLTRTKSQPASLPSWLLHFFLNYSFPRISTSIPACASK